MAAKSPEPIARGQRVWHEVVFEPDPEMVARVRHVRRPKTRLPHDEHREARAGLPNDAATDVAVPVETPSVWEAIEDDL